MNYVISIVKPDATDIVLDIAHTLKTPVSVVMYGRGTATKRMMDLLGIESKERRVVLTIADEAQTAELIHAQYRRLYIGVPGNGIVIAVPMKSVGGGKTLAYLSDGKPAKGAPSIRYDYELVTVIANEGYTDDVMDAARAAGATGGTILHGKGTNARKAEEFFKVSIASEKEVILIVARSGQKAAIMQSILETAGPSSPAGAIVFSLPITEIGGFRLLEEDSPSPEAPASHS